MLTSFRFFEIILYAAINILPYMFLAIYPFRSNLRFKGFKLAFLITLVLILQIGFTLLNTMNIGPVSSVLSICSTICYALYFFIAINDHPGKILFVLLIISNVANLVVVSAKCMEGIFFPAKAIHNNCWTFSMFSVLVQAILFPALFYFFKHYINKAIASHVNKYFSLYLWTIPATFYLFWFHALYFSSESPSEMARRPSTAIFTLFINLGSFLVYYVIVKLIEETSTNIKLNEQNTQLAIQALQYENLKERMDETRRARHDLRQHMNLIYSMVENHEYNKLTSYLKEYRSLSSMEKPILYCEHFSLNATIAYYAQQFSENDIKFDYRLTIPQDIPVPDTDLCVLFGNMLENSFEACLKVETERRFVNLIVSMPNSTTMVIALDNSYSGNIKMDENNFFSSKHAGHGIGTESIKHIVSTYNGSVTFNAADNIFKISAVLIW